MANFGALQSWLADGAACLRFFSRLPVPSMGDGDDRPFGVAIRMLPVAGAVIGACVALPLGLGALAGLPSTMAAILATTAGVVATGALHEDGLADAADGLGGGASRMRKLAIMRDSRIGTYGVVALVLALGWRIAAMSALIDRMGPWRAAVAVVAAAILSRALCLLPLALLRPARDDGLAHGVGALERQALTTCFGVAAILSTALPLLAGLSIAQTALGGVLAAGAAAGVTELARRQIGGHTGDIAGACQQVAEAGFLLGLLLAPGMGGTP